MAAIAALAISAGVSAYGAYSASKASKKAAAQQTAAGERALALQKSQYDAAQSQLAPYTGVGAEAVGKLRTMADNPQALDLPTFQYGEFVAPDKAAMESDPAYQLRQKEDQRAIQQSAAARGGGLGGNTLTALQDRSQALASDEYANTYNRALTGYQTNASTAYQNYLSRYQKATGEYAAGQEPWNRWTQLAGIGVGATDRNINVGQNYANQAGNLYTDIGNVQAAGTIGQANAINQGLQGVAGAVQGYAGLQAYNQAARQPAVTPPVLQPTTTAQTFNTPMQTTAPQPAYGTWGYSYGTQPWYQQQQPQNPWNRRF
jgi:hypothetical protein